jgi:hypothetical protein
MKKRDIIVLIGMAFVIFLALELFYTSSNPTFIENKLDSLLSNEVLMDSIRGNQKSYFEVKFSQKNFKEKDSLEYTIKVVGKGGCLYYRGVQTKTSSGTWTVRRESISIEPNR